MRFLERSRLNAVGYVLSAAVAISALTGASLYFAHLHGGMNAVAAPASTDPLPPDTVELTGSQLVRVPVAPIGYRDFRVEEPAVGSIDFDEDMETQVFTPYQGRIVNLYARIGDDVEKGQPLFTIDSSDLIQADSTLISAAGVLRLTTRALDRAKELYAAKGLAQKDYDQAVSDQMTADGNYKAAFEAVRIFGKTDAEIQKVADTRKIDPLLVVPSPVTGRITARSASPGLFVQPGNAPAPFTVTDISNMWLVANVPESTIARYHLGQQLAVSIMAYPGATFDGKITTMGQTVDPNSHRLFLRSKISDPQHRLRSGMFATFVIKTGDTEHSLAIPQDGIAREGDGTMSAWVTTDKKLFTQRTVRLGMTQDGYDQVLDGLKPGEMIATDGALFLNNALAGVDTD